MADTAIDSRIVEILNRLESIETTMNQYKGSKEKEGAIDNYKKDNKHRLRADLSDLKSRLAALNDSDDSDSVDDADDADVADNASDSSSVCGIPEDIVQRLNRVNWTQFKNHVVGDDSYIIDVLIGPVKSHWHIRQEKANLPQTGVDETKLGTGPIVGKPADQGAPTVEKERTESQPELPERIRINGSNLSQTLLDVAGMVNRDRDYFHFIRPYKLLIRHEKALRGRFLKLLALREKSLREVVQEQPSTESNQFDVANGEIGFDVDITSTQNTELIVYPDVEIDEREFHGLECLLGFMDTYLMPVYERYRSATAKKIRFSDLWYLYRPGDLVVMRNESKKKVFTTRPPAKFNQTFVGYCRYLEVEPISIHFMGQKMQRDRLWSRYITSASKATQSLTTEHRWGPFVRSLRLHRFRVRRISTLWTPVLCGMLKDLKA